MKNFQALAALLFATVIQAFVPASSAQTLSLNDASVIQPNPSRVGLNIGSVNYYDNGQILKNLIGANNPSFEPLIQRQIWALTSGGSTTTFTVPDTWDAVPPNYWVGGTVTVLQSQSGGAETGCTSTVASNTGPNYPVSSSSPWITPTITISTPCAAPFAVGDVVVINKTTFPTPESWWETSTGGMWGSVSGGAKLLSDTTDLCPTCGKQALNMNASASGSSAYANWYFDTGTGMDLFVLMNGTYQFKFWAKAASGQPSVTITAQRFSQNGFNCGSYKPTLTSTWTQYTWTCTAAETSATAPGTADVAMQVSGGSIYIDNVDFEKVSSNPSNTSVVRDEVVETLQKYFGNSAGGPSSVLRDWLGQNGETLDNWTSPNYAISPTTSGTGYFTGPNGTGNLSLSLEDYLVLCQLLGVDPYLEVPVTFTTTEAANLIEFLAAPAGTTYGSRRAALGQSNPWTSVFNKIHLGFCNECWNMGSFSGQALFYRSNAPNQEYYYDYSIRSRDIFSAMRGDSYYTPGSFDLVMNAQTGVTYTMDTALQRAHPDSVEIEGYMYGTVNSFSSDAALWAPAFAEPYVHATNPSDPLGFYSSVTTYHGWKYCGPNGNAACNVNVYEWGQNTLSGSIDQQHMDYINAGAGQGVIMALQPLLNIQNFGIQPQALFSLTEYMNGAANGHTSKLWGNVIDMGGATNNVRPGYLGVSLVNQSIIGPMYSCPISNNPTYNLAASNNGNPTTPALSNVPYLFAFCFQNGSKRSMVLINTDLTNSHSLSFTGTNPPAGTVQVRQYAPSNLNTLNENPTGTPSNTAPEPLSINTSSISNPSSISLPAHSVTALDYTISGTPTAMTPAFSPAGGSYSSTQTVTLSSSTSGAVIHYTTDGSTPTASSATYSGPITVSATQTVQAIAVASGYANSGVASATYTIQQQAVATPTFSVAGGTYTSAQTVSIADATSGATIYYTTNGSTPTTSSAVYSGAISISATATLQAIAVKSGYANSAVASATYTISSTLPTPSFSVAGGSYTSAQSVSIADATAGTTIYYTTNGSTPTTSSAVYSGAIGVSASATLKAMAVKSGYTNSAVASATYTIAAASVLPAPAFSVQAGTYSSAQSVSLSDSVAGTTIYYTTNGTTPTTSSSVYSSAIAVSTTQTIQAIAVKAGYTNSPVATAAYTIGSSSSYVNIAQGGFTASSMLFNGGASVTSSGTLLVTDGGTNEARSAWFSSRLPVQSFVTDFKFQQTNANGDGLTFTIQAKGPTAVGTAGGGLGYQGITNSVAIKFDLMSNAGEGYDSTGIYTNGAAPTTPSVDLSSTPINLHSSDVMAAHIVYDGTNLTLTLTDTKTLGTFTKVFPVNIPSIVGATTAYVGFTGGTGAGTVTQNVLSWTYSAAASSVGSVGATAPPPVVTPTAAPTFSPAGGSYSTAQSVTISDATSGAAIYYTVDGSTPTTSSAKYTGPVTVSSTGTLKAIAVASGATTSAVVSAAYTINAGTTYINLGSGAFNASSFLLNGSAKIASAGALQITDGGTTEHGSAWFSNQVPVQKFTTDFTFQLLNPNADGVTFAIQGLSPTALGATGSGLGYAGITKSLAIKFDLHNNSGEGVNSTGFYLNGVAPTVPSIDLTPSGINLHSGDVLSAHIVYDGTQITMTLTDTVTKATFTASYAVNLPSVVGSNNAYVGFTGGTGGSTVTANVLTWNYTTQQ